MPTTIQSGIEWQEFAEGWQEHWSPEEVNAQRIADVTWADADKFIQDMLGNHFQEADGTLRRYLPEPHPDFPGLFCTEANLIATLGEVGFGTGVPGGDVISYETARYQLRYASLPYEVRTDEDIDASSIGELDRYVERSVTYATENVQLPGGAFEFSDTHKPILEPGVKPLFSKELTYVWHLVPDVPDTAIAAGLNTLNKNEFDNTYPPGVLLFAGADVKRLPSTPTGALSPVGGLPLWRITYKFLYRAGGWNSFFRPTDTNGNAAPDFYPINVVGNANKSVFESSDFDNLFKLQAA